MKQIQTKKRILGYTPEGQTVIDLSEEEKLALVQLHSDPKWHIYRDVLSNLVEGNLRGAMPAKTPEEAFAKAKESAGINWSINQLTLMVDQIKKEEESKAKEEEERAKKR